MNSVLERWLRLPLRGQIAMATACFVLATLMLWLLLVRPQRLAQQELRVDIARLEQSYQQQLAQLSALPAEALLRAQLTDIADHSDAPRAVPLETLLAARGSQLEAWQPESEPRSVTLLLAWEQFQPLFADLASTEVPFPARFLLEAHQGKVRARLWLESDDAR